MLTDDGLVDVSKAFNAGDVGVTMSNNISGLRERLRAAMVARRAQYEDIVDDMFLKGERKRVPSFIAGLDTGFEEADKLIDRVFGEVMDDGTPADSVL